MVLCVRIRCSGILLRIPRTKGNHTMREMAYASAGNTNQYLIVGLGNSDYPQTRHSIGMTAVDTLARHLDVQWTRNKALVGMVAKTTVNSVNLILLKPRIPMNINGKSIAKAVNHFHVAPSCVYLVHDELDKPVGRWSLKEGGSARGHNGVKSAMNSLQSDEMMRLRIGIDRPADRRDVANYVLTKFFADELNLVKQAITSGLSGLLGHIQNRVDHDCCLTSIIPSCKAA